MLEENKIMEYLEKIYLFVVVDFPNILFRIDSLDYQNIVFGNSEGIRLVTIIYFLISRELLHIIGGITFAMLSYELSFFKKRLDIILIAFLTLIVLFQEMYLHPLLFQQTFLKGVVDIIFWLSPVYVYLFIRYKYINYKKISRFFGSKK